MKNTIQQWLKLQICRTLQIQQKARPFKYSTCSIWFETEGTTKDRMALEAFSLASPIWRTRSWLKASMSRLQEALEREVQD
jgi:hypothetical protein